jgi:predicted ribosome quality control (RQC) complex YloA/Tae2 family protein
MYVDFLTLACLRDRLDGLLGARVQRVVLQDELSLGLELYAGARFHLHASARAQHPRLLLVPERTRRGVEAETPLLLLLRKWVRGARLVDVTQPPWERVLTLHFDGQTGPCRLVVELIGRYSNLILVGPEGRVLEAAKRVGSEMNRYRVTLPAQPYQPPPVPPGRVPPTALSQAEWRVELASAAADEPLQRLLVRRLLGVSPLAAREISFRSTGHPDGVVAAAAPEAVADAIAALFAPLHDGSWAPHVALGADGEVVAFAAYEPRQFDRVAAVQDISAAMLRYFQHHLSLDPYAGARQRVQAQIDAARKRVDRALGQLESQLKGAPEMDALREAGELLLTYQHRVPRGVGEVTLPDYAGKPRAIQLDPKLTPVENAQAIFRRYEKANRAAAEVPKRVRALKVDRAYLDQLASDLALAESRPEIDAVHRALSDAGWGPKTRRRAGPVGGPRRLEIDGVPVLVGRNARQNEEVTFRHAGPDDLWLHVRDLPGAHVVVKCGKREVSEATILRAAVLAAHYSPARGGGRVPVDVTQRRFVRRLRTGRPGLVRYRRERTLWVDARDATSGTASVL